MTPTSKHDFAAAIAIALMFAGAFVLPVSSWGVALIGAGTLAMLLLILGAVRERS